MFWSHLSALDRRGLSALISLKSIVYEEEQYLTTDALVNSIKDGLKCKVEYNGYFMKKGGRTEARVKSIL